MIRPEHHGQTQLGGDHHDSVEETSQLLDTRVLIAPHRIDATFEVGASRTNERQSGDQREPDVIRVFLLDDHEIVRRGVRELLEAADDIEVVGEAATAEEALRTRAGGAARTSPCSTCGCRDGNGIEVCRDLQLADAELRCLMLTSFDDDEALFDAIVAGASGYILKEVRGGRPRRRDPPRRRRRVAARPASHGQGHRAAAQPEAGRRPVGRTDVTTGAADPRRCSPTV